MKRASSVGDRLSGVFHTRRGIHSYCRPLHTLPRRTDGLSRRVDVLSSRIDVLSRRVDVLSRRINILSWRRDVLLTSQSLLGIDIASCSFRLRAESGIRLCTHIGRSSAHWSSAGPSGTWSSVGSGDWVDVVRLRWCLRIRHGRGTSSPFLFRSWSDLCGLSDVGRGNLFVLSFLSSAGPANMLDTEVGREQEQ